MLNKIVQKYINWGKLSKKNQDHQTKPKLSNKISKNLVFNQIRILVQFRSKVSRFKSNLKMPELEGQGFSPWVKEEISVPVNQLEESQYSN